MAKKKQNACLGCGEDFVPDVRNRGRQKYCPKPGCRAQAKAARQRRWREKPQNRDYFQGAWNVERVRQWRAAHPGYWRAHRRQRAGALQDALMAQPIDRAQEPADPGRLALQDALKCQGPVLIGLIAHLADSALQDDIAVTTRQLLQRGQDILSGRAFDASQAGAAP